MTRAWLAIVAALACGLWPADSLGADAAAPDFNKDVLPILNMYCVGCHGAEDKESGLALDTHEGILAGGDGGPVVVAGKSTESRLIRVLIGKDDVEMPPEGSEPPTRQEIDVLAAWIDAGAKPPKQPASEKPMIVAPRIEPTVPVSEAVSAVAIAPDGKLLAVARYDAVELTWLPERTLLRRLAGHRGRINALAFSADGERLLAAGGEPGVFGEVRLWNVADGQPAGVFEGHSDSLYAAVLSPDGKLLATAGYDQRIKLWDVASGGHVRTLAGHNDAVFDLAFRADGKVLASASGDRTVKLWGVADGERLDTFGQPTQELYALAFSPDGQRVAAGGADNRIRVWQITAEAKENTNPLLYSRFAHEGAIVSLVYSADGKTLVSAGEDRTVKLWNAEPMTERVLLEPQSDWAPALAISPDGKSVAVGRLDGSLAFYDAASGEAAPVPPAARPELAALSVHGVQSGTANRVTLTGKHLAEATAVKAGHDQIATSIVSIESGAKLEVDVAPAADMPRGRYELWVVSAGGESQKLRLYVDDVPQVQEAEPNDAVAEANEVSLPASVWGTLSAKGDVDSFAFEAQAGQRLVFDVAASDIGSKANCILTLYDAAGQALADNNSFGGTNDPLLAFDVPADGRYVIQVSDLMLDGSGEHTYRLTLGELALATGAYPLGVPADRSSEVEVTGFNLPAGLKVRVPATAAGKEVAVPLDARAFRTRQPLKVVVGSPDEAVEIEPNDTPQEATPLAVPGTVNGRIGGETGPGDDDYFRFESKAGQTWIVETEAARRGSPVDTLIDVLDAQGTPIERVLLQAVRDSNVTFRGIDGNTRDCRVTHWEEMQLNQLLYLNGEVVKLFRAPQGPDSGFLFYEGHGGKRLLYYDTTATAHAVEEPCYIVEPHPPGAKLISTGLPVFPIYYTNDDDAQRKLGSDSRLTFTAPADGAYLVRVRDARGFGGDRFAYRLTVRHPAPDFALSVRGGDSVPAGSGKQFTLAVDRIDGFDDAVRVDIAGLPEGFRVSTPIVIPAGHRDARGVLLADADAKKPTAEDLQKIDVRATATIGGEEIVKKVNAFGKLSVAAPPKLLVHLEPAEIVVAPGSSTSAMIRVERNGFDNETKLTVENMPHGVIVADIGLSGVLMRKGENERQIFITADAWVPEETRLCFAVEQQAGGQCSAPVVIHVRRPSPLAETGK